MADPASALPWASGTAAAAAEPETVVEDLAAVPIDQLALSIGDRIEVKWQLQDDEDRHLGCQWWTANIQQQQEQTGTSTTGPSYVIKYAAMGEDFPEETGVVRFHSPHALSSDGVLLSWRKEGEDYSTDEEGSDMEEEVAAAAAADGRDGPGQEGVAPGDVLVTRDDLLNAANLPVTQVEEDLMKLPGAEAAMDKFSTMLKGFLAAKADQARAAGEGPPVITRSDMEEFKAMMLTMAHTTRGGA